MSEFSSLLTAAYSGLEMTSAHAGLDAAMRARGFESLTSIQRAVLAPELAGRDLRLTSQTGSGKTVAVGLLIATAVERAAAAPGATTSEGLPARARGAWSPAQPTALIIAPTRELAGQLERELTWLYEPLAAGVAVVMGGTSVAEERRQLGRKPVVVVGTPGRLLDHLRRGALELERLTSLVLDEADVMIDMDFEEELDAILEFAPAERRTHLVSATFRREVVALADRLQRDAAVVQGTALGVANEDIDHQAICIEPRQRFDAVVNLLLRYPEDKTLLFVRTRADTQELASMLIRAGFRAGALNGEMTHRERTSAFAGFRSGAIRFLVATDVAARGLDVQDITRVVQVDLPDSGDTFTHRSGRTGRAGRRGTNVVLVPRHAVRRAQTLFRSAKVRPADGRVPDQAEISRAADERLCAALRASEAEAAAPLQALAAKLLAERSPEQVVAWLLADRKHAGPCPAREVSRPTDHIRPSGRSKKHGDGRFDRRGQESSAGHGRRAASGSRAGNSDYVAFQVSWGGQRGADAGRLLALACRRGGVTRDDVGAIRIGPRSSSIEISAAAASSFEDAARRPDPRDPHVRFRRWQSAPLHKPRGSSSRPGGDSYAVKRKPKWANKAQHRADR